MSPTEKDTKKKNLLLKYIYGFLLHKKYIKKYNVADIKKKKKSHNSLAKHRWKTTKT